MSAFDFDRAEGRRKKSRTKAPSKSNAATLTTSLRMAHGSARVTSMFAAAVLAAVVTGIIVNALALQKGRHPAPFFGRSFALPESAPPSVVPIAPTRPAAAAVSSAPAQVRPQPVAAPAPSADASKSIPAADPIGQLIKSGAPGKQASSPHAGRPHPTPAPQ